MSRFCPRRPWPRQSGTATPWPWKASPTDPPCGRPTRSFASASSGPHAIRMPPDLIYGQDDRHGLRRQAVYRAGGNPGVAPRSNAMSDAVEKGWPHTVEIEEHPTPPWSPMPTRPAPPPELAIFRARSGSTAQGQFQDHAIICQFSGEELAAVPAHSADVPAPPSMRCAPIEQATCSSKDVGGPKER